MGKTGEERGRGGAGQGSKEVKSSISDTKGKVVSRARHTQIGPKGNYGGKWFTEDPAVWSA